MLTFTLEPSKQYDGMFEITGKDSDGREYYLATTPCGRILARPMIEPKTPQFRKRSADESVI